MTPGGKPRVLIVEDESLVAMLIEDMLGDLGYEVAALVARVDQAVQMARTIEADYAILDLNLNGQRTDAVAEILRARGIRFIFATGYGVAGVSAEWRDVPVVQKPFQLEELSAALARIRT
jgi:CheY-like chemotaxis protein